MIVCFSTTVRGESQTVGNSPLPNFSSMLNLLNQPMNLTLEVLCLNEFNEWSLVAGRSMTGNRALDGRIH